jgi:hypothetical protein
VLIVARCKHSFFTIRYNIIYTLDNEMLLVVDCSRLVQLQNTNCIQSGRLHTHNTRFAFNAAIFTIVLYFLYIAKLFYAISGRQLTPMCEIIIYLAF